MPFKHRLQGLGALLFLAFASLAGASAPAYAQGISQKVAVCDPAYVNRCTKPTADGSVEVSGNIITITSSPVVSTTAYSTGDVMGTKLTLANAVRQVGGSGLLQEVMLSFKSSQTAQTDFFFCNSDPSATTFTDNGAIALAAADFAKCRAVHITDCTNEGTPSVCTAGSLAMPITIAGATTGYGFLVTRGTPTLASTSDLTVTVRILRN